MSKVIACTDETLKTESSEGLVLIDFMADWCNPCQQLMPILDEVAQEHDGQAKIVKVNVDQSPASTKEYGVRGIPALFIVKNGEIVQRLVGLQTKDALTKALNSHA
ncbi:MAG: thioredoxin [Aestuariibacter sp.]|nr:thioredoxin [Aestuariibacter sp.]|tara:strand:- start:43853 stop:44170 length:318 start_codon:yes stop_codon:yes gene_type:complete